MGLLDEFRHGGSQYPLDDETETSLLETADPALHWAILFFTHVLNKYVKPRLLTQAALERLNFPSAVVKTIHVEPTPFLLSNQTRFPLFCLYRSEGEWSLNNATNINSSSIWKCAYVLPPMTPRALEQLHPILRSVEVTLATFALASYDPTFEDRKTLRDLSGIKKIRPGRFRYEPFDATENGTEWWPALTGEFFVDERDELVIERTEPFEGVDGNIDLAAKDVQTVTDFVQFKTELAPVIETIAPNAGSKAGGQPFAIYGENFKPGSDTKVLIGGAYASNVAVVHPTKIQGLTPAHDAAPTFAADVQIIGWDGQVSNVLTGAYTFTTP